MNIETIIAQFELQTSWLINSLENITDAESSAIIGENLNPVKWIAGHATNSRMTVLNILTEKPYVENYAELFGKGSSAQPDDTFPHIEQIKQDWLEVSSELRLVLNNLTEEKLVEKPPFQTSIPNETIAGLIAFFAIHESFHIGQISILRKLLGKEAMSMGLKRN